MLENLILRLRAWWRVKGDIERLHQLDDRILADMGVAREHITAFAWGKLKKPDADITSLPVRAQIAISSPHPRIARRRPAAAYAPARGRALVAQQMENCQ